MSQQTLDRPTSDKKENPKYPPLTTHDRCDGVALRATEEGGTEKGTCGAQAFVRVVLPSGFDLLFCGHCLGEQTLGKSSEKAKAARNASDRAVLEQMGAVIDNSAYATINLKPSDGSDAKGF